MRTIEYRRWAPPASRLTVEFPSEVLYHLGLADSVGLMFGSKQRDGVWIRALSAPADEEQEKVGVFVSRIRGEVFLTEADLGFMNQQRADLALVVAGSKAGFFVREADGSIQTVRSHEEFPVASSFPPPLQETTVTLEPAAAGKRSWLTARLVPLLLLPLAAVAMLPQHPVAPAPGLEVHEAGGQLRISWNPATVGVLSIRDTDRRVSVPIRKNQSTATYVARGSDVAISLLGVNAENRVIQESTRYLSGVKRAP